MKNVNVIITTDNNVYKGRVMDLIDFKDEFSKSTYREIQEELKDENVCSIEISDSDNGKFIAEFILEGEDLSVIRRNGKTTSIYVI